MLLLVSVILFTGRVPGPGGCLVPDGGVWSRGVPGCGGAWLWGVPGPRGRPGPGEVPGPGGVPVTGGAWSQGGAWSRGVVGPGGCLVENPRMATAAGSTHPTECILVLVKYLFFQTFS